MKECHDVYEIFFITEDLDFPDEYNLGVDSDSSQRNHFECLVGDEACLQDAERYPDDPCAYSYGCSELHPCSVRLSNAKLCDYQDADGRYAVCPGNDVCNKCRKGNSAVTYCPGRGDSSYNDYYCPFGYCLGELFQPYEFQPDASTCLATRMDACPPTRVAPMYAVGFQTDCWVAIKTVDESFSSLYRCPLGPDNVCILFVDPHILAKASVNKEQSSNKFNWNVFQVSAFLSICCGSYCSFRSYRIRRSLQRRNTTIEPSTAAEGPLGCKKEV